MRRGQGGHVFAHKEGLILKCSGQKTFNRGPADAVTQTQINPHQVQQCKIQTTHLSVQRGSCLSLRLRSAATLTRLLLVSLICIVCGCFQSRLLLNSNEVNQWDHAGHREKLAFRLLFTHFDTNTRQIHHTHTSTYQMLILYICMQLHGTFCSPYPVH